MRLATIALPAGESFLEVETVRWFAVWWRESRPGWVDLGWWAVPVREDLLPIQARQPGPELAAALKELPVGRGLARRRTSGILCWTMRDTGVPARR